MNKKLLYESIMRSVSREVKKALNENVELLFNFDVHVDDTDFCIDDDVFAHTMYGTSIFDLDELEYEPGDNPEKAEKHIHAEMRKFAKELNNAVSHLGVSVEYKNGGIRVSNVNDDNYWDYFKTLVNDVNIPGEPYVHEVNYFLPSSNVDDDMVFDYLCNYFPY